MHTRKARQLVANNSLHPWAGRCSAMPGEQGSITYNITWEDQSHYSKSCPLPHSFPHFIYWVGCHMVWNSLWVSLGHLNVTCVLTVSFPNLPCAFSHLISVAAQKAQKVVALCKPCSVKPETFLYYQPCSHHKSKTQPHISHGDEN